MFSGGDKVYAEKKLPDVEKKLDAVRQEMKRAEPEFKRLKDENALLERELNNLSERLVIISEKINISEGRIDLLEEDIKTLDAEEQNLTANLQTKRAETSRILSAMGRLSLAPASPLGAVDDERKEIQAGLVLKSLNRSLREKADALVKELEHLDNTRNALRERRTKLGSEKLSLDHDRQRMEVLLHERQKRFEENNSGLKDKQAYLKKLSQKERNVTNLIAQIQKQEKKAAERKRQDMLAEERRLQAQRDSLDDQKEADSVQLSALTTGKSAFYGQGEGGVLSARAFNMEKGKLAMPASGKVIYGFGARDLTGKKRLGMTIRTRASGIVTTPSRGQVIFVGKFRDYGHMVIVKPTDKYHILVAGLGRTDVVVGQNIIKGEPVGRMPKGSGFKNLYLEMRKNKKPIDPVIWLKRYTQLAEAKKTR
ncbi:MAG: peptidoglycan DD-metalloendopeptidase family protein [Pseudomonadota bacterium]